MQLTLEEKREIVVKNKDPVIAAIKSTLDSYYTFLSPNCDEHLNLIEKSFDNKEHFNAAKEIKEDSIKFENLLKKIKANTILNNEDIARIGIAFNFCKVIIEKRIASLQEAKEMCSDFSEKFFSKIKES